MAYRLRTSDGIFPLDNLKEYGEYMVHFHGGRLIKHTEKIYIYEEDFYPYSYCNIEL